MLAPTVVALIVGAGAFSLVVQRHDRLGRRHLADRADVVEAAVGSIDRDADRAAASMAGALSVTSDPAQLNVAITALIDASSLVSTVAIVDGVGTIVATNEDSSLVARAVVDAPLSGLSPLRASLVLSDADGERARLLFAALSPG